MNGIPTNESAASEVIEKNLDCSTILRRCGGRVIIPVVVGASAKGASRAMRMIMALANGSFRSACRSTLAVVAACGVGLAACGCGAKAPSGGEHASSSSGNSSSGESKAAASNDAPAGAKKNAARNDVYADARGTKWVGKVPYDAFFDNPLAVASNSNKVAGAAPAPATDAKPAEKPEAMASTDTPKAADSATAAPAGDEWTALISAKDIEDEVKEIRNRTSAGLTGVGQYNGKYKDMQSDGAVVAALGSIAQHHSETVKWKANAKYVREYGSQIEKSANGLGKKPYEATQGVFDKLTGVLDGNTPTDADVPEDAPLHDKASRKMLMYRMQRAKDWMRKEITTEAKYKAEIDKVKHEASLLGTITKAQLTPGYEFVEDENYRKHVKEMIDAAIIIRKSVETQDFKAFEGGIINVEKKCNGCHTDFVGGA